MRKTRLTRKSSLARSPMKRGRKPLKKRGETKRKKELRYAAYLRSPEWKARRKACLERYGYRCQARYLNSQSVVPVLGVMGWQCERRATQAHHLTYARFGNEHEDDLLPLCKTCHDLVEAEYFPHRKTMKRYRWGS